MELKKLPHIEIEVAPLPGKKLPAAVNTLRKLDVKKVGLIAGGTAAVLTVVSVASRYGIYRGAVAAELKEVKEYNPHYESLRTYENVLHVFEKLDFDHKVVGVMSDVRA